MSVTEEPQLPWGLPADAPAPVTRSTWGSVDPHAAPVSRTDPDDDTPGEPAASFPAAPVWEPLPDPVAGAEFDFAGLHAGTRSDDAQEAAVTAPVNPFDPFSDDTAAAVPPPAESLFGGDDAALPDVVRSDATPAVAGDHTPAVADGAGSLASMFDESPVAAADVAAVPSPVEYGTREEAMGAWRARQAESMQRAADADVVAQAADQLNTALTHRYASTARLQDTVDRLLALAQSGDPKVQATINGFVLTRDPALDAQQRAAYEAVMVPAMAANMVHIANPADAQAVFDIAYDEVIGIGPLGPLWRDDTVTEILVSGPNKVVCERDGELVPTPVKFRDLAHLKTTARDLAQRVDDRALSRSNPLVTAQLPGARVQFAVAPVAPVSGVSITIRKFRPLFGLPDLLRFGALNDDMVALLSDVVAARATILVSGGTGSGKTTMINALSAFIPANERVITIEDALELSLENAHVEALLTKELASGDDRVVIGQGDLLRASLRMRPDRIIVGEIRDGAGCSVMLQAANTGHDGTMTTVHANGPDLALRRLAMLLQQANESMTSEIAAEEVRMAFDVVVQVVRVRGRRFISAISAVDKSAGGATIPLFVGRYTSADPAPVFGRAGSLGADTDLARRLADAGIDPSVWR